MARDQGVFAYVGHVIRAGGMPYKDAWELKGPTAILPYTLMEFIFGRNMWATRVFDVFMMGANMAAVFTIARAWWDRKAGWYAVVILGFCMVTMDFWLTSQPDTWCGCLIAIAIALLAGAARSVSATRFALAGICIGVCVLGKPIYGMYFLVMLPALIWKWREGQFVRSIFAIAVGFLLPIASVSAWLAAHGALNAAIDAFLLFTVRTHAMLHIYSVTQQVNTFFLRLRTETPLSTFMLPAILGGVLMLRYAARRPGRPTLLSDKLSTVTFFVWLIAGLLFVIVQRKYFNYYWYPLLPWMAAGSAIALRQAREILVPTPARWNLRVTVAHVALLWFALLYGPLPLHYVLQWVRYKTGRMSHEQYEDIFSFIDKDYYWFPRIEAVASYVQAHTTPNQSVLVWGFEAVINFLSDRFSPTRFDYDYPLAAGADTVYQAAYRAEFMQALTANRPTYIVVADHDQNVLVKSSSKEALKSFAELNGFIHAHYVLETTIYDWDLWRLKQ